MVQWTLGRDFSKNPSRLHCTSDSDARHLQSINTQNNTERINRKCSKQKDRSEIETLEFGCFDFRRVAYIILGVDVKLYASCPRVNRANDDLLCNVIMTNTVVLQQLS
jgi:hypothetical protein